MNKKKHLKSNKKKNLKNTTQSNQIAQYPIPTIISIGLPNLGNTCFANALLQCLYHISEFKQALYQIKEVQYSQNNLKAIKKLKAFFSSLDTKEPIKIENSLSQLIQFLFSLNSQV